MRKVLLIIIAISFIVMPVLSQEGGTPSSDYTIVLMKKSPAEKIKALEGYIKKYPDTSNKYTKFAYYWLSMNYFKVKNLPKAIKYGLKSEKYGGIEESMKAQLYFVLGRSYASRGDLFNKTKALNYIGKAIKSAKTAKLGNLLKQANKVKKKLSTPPKPSETPVQKIKRLYSEEDFEGVIATYGKVDQNDKTLHLIYSNALFKNENFKKALIQFKKIYANEKKAKYAKKIADCNSELSKKYRSRRDLYLKDAVRYYIEAGLLYGRESNKVNKKNAILLAKNMVYKKYNLQKKIAAYNRKIKNNKSFAVKNKTAIKKAERDLKRFKRYLRREYRGMTPPGYELKKKRKLENKIKSLKSGGNSSKSDNGAAALKAEIKKADDELNLLIKQAKLRL